MTLKELMAKLKESEHMTSLQRELLDSERARHKVELEETRRKVD